MPRPAIHQNIKPINGQLMSRQVRYHIPVGVHSFFVGLAIT
ncbi:MAG: hypothetical protein ACLP1Y_07915 [Candidatus Acidiferrales bacterium]